MKKFLVTYHAPAEALKQTEQPSEEEMKEGMKPWMQWAEKCGDKLVDLGNPLVNGKNMKSDGKLKDSNRQVCGFSILQTENMDEARSLMDGHPHLMWRDDCEVEIHELMPLPGL
ncbi:MAG: hypothetical protein WDZ35_09695 [Crocinitomicaceae bacterium]